MASFLIINNPTSLDQGCSKAAEILYIAWEMNLLKTKFICHHESKGRLIYSYNPYTDQAPLPWQLKESYQKNGHFWTLFERSYHQDSQKFCKDLDFDQTKNLGSYVIQLGLYKPEFVDNNQFSRLEFKSSTDYYNILAYYISHTFKLRSKVTLFKSTDELWKQIFLKSIDVCLNPTALGESTATQRVYPYLPLELAFITQHRGNLSQIEKLLRVIDRFSRYGVVIVCFITFIFFKFFLRQSGTSAILTIVRLICNAAVPDPPNIVATRIYLSGLFIFVMTLQGIYQGKLASLLTKPVALPNAETLDDLKNFNYTIYGDEVMISILKEINYSGPVVAVENNCVEYVLRDDSAACITRRHFLFYSGYINDLHVSDSLRVTLFTYIIRNDWPFQERLNLLLSRLFESNIIEREFLQEYQLFWRKQKFREKEKENQGPLAIALKDLAFAFAFLGIGLAVATVVFFIELWKGRK